MYIVSFQASLQRYLNPKATAPNTQPWAAVEALPNVDLLLKEKQDGGLSIWLPVFKQKHLKLCPPPSPSMVSVPVGLLHKLSVPLRLSY